MKLKYPSITTELQCIILLNILCIDEEVYLRYHYIRDEGAKEITEALKANATLTSISIHILKL